MEKYTGLRIGIAFSSALAAETFLADLALAGEPLPKAPVKASTPVKGKEVKPFIAPEKPKGQPAVDWDAIRRANPAPEAPRPTPIKALEAPKPTVPTQPQVVSSAPSSAESVGRSLIKAGATVLTEVGNFFKGVGLALYEITLQQPIVGLILDILVLYLGYRLVRAIFRK